jgi:hypothetical protein
METTIYTKKKYREVINHEIFFGYKIVEKCLSRRYSDYFIENNQNNFVINEKCIVTKKEMFYEIFKLLKQSNIVLDYPKTELEIFCFQEFAFFNNYEERFLEFLKKENLQTNENEFVVYLRQHRFGSFQDYIKDNYKNAWQKFEGFCYYDSPYATPNYNENELNSSGGKHYILNSLNYINSDKEMKLYFELCKGGKPKENNYKEKYIRVFV